MHLPAGAGWLLLSLATASPVNAMNQGQAPAALALCPALLALHPGPSPPPPPPRRRCSGCAATAGRGGRFEG